MTKARILFALAALIAALPAEPARAQSVFGVNFIGEHLQRGGARSGALGHSALAVPDTINVITQNASSTADLGMLSFSLTQIFGTARISREDEFARKTRFMLPAIMIAAPLRGGLVLSGGYRTRFAGRADFSVPREIEQVPAAWERYRLDSSLFSVPLVLAWKPHDALNVSAEAQLERGSIADGVAVSFDDPAYRDVESNRRRSFSGSSWGASFLLRVHPRVWLAGVYDAPVSYTVDETITHTGRAFDSSSVFDFTLPAAWSAGAAVNVLRRWWVTSSYWTRNAPRPAGFVQLEGAVGDETHFGVGIERRMAAGGSLLERAPLRLGFSMQRWHVEFPAGRPVRSIFLAVGTAFRMPASPGCIDVTAEFGRVGSAGDNGIEEKIFRLSFGISVAERWQRRSTVKH